MVDPNFASNRRFYTLQSHTGRTMEVIAWTISEDYTNATRDADPLVGGLPLGPGPTHSGGRLLFGPEGYLWVATGDGYSGTAPQDLSSLGGKVLRVDSQTSARAPGNPFESSLVYAYGFRNPQGLALRPKTNQILLIEHGPDYDDEINLLVAGKNYGWDPIPAESAQGTYDEDTPPMTDLLKFPDAVEARWTSGESTIATSGGTFLEGDDWEEWEGRLAVATLRSRSLRIFEFTSSGNLVSHVVVPELLETYGRLRSPVPGPDGALYITTSNGGGRDRILRVTASLSPAFLTDQETSFVTETLGAQGMVTKVLAIDPKDATLTYTLSGTDAAAFTVTGAGELRANEALDYETKSLYQVTVTATNPDALSDSMTLSIGVTNEEEAGTVTLVAVQPQVGTPFTATLEDDDIPAGASWQWYRTSSRGSTGTAITDDATSASYTPRRSRPGQLPAGYRLLRRRPRHGQDRRRSQRLPGAGGAAGPRGARVPCERRLLPQHP